MLLNSTHKEELAFESISQNSRGYFKNNCTNTVLQVCLYSSVCIFRALKPNFALEKWVLYYFEKLKNLSVSSALNIRVDRLNYFLAFLVLRSPVLRFYFFQTFGDQNAHIFLITSAGRILGLKHVLFGRYWWKCTWLW